MNRIVQIITAIAISFVFAGCGKMEGTGGAITSTVVDTESGPVSMATIYGYSGADDKIAFSIFTNIHSENTVSTVSGSWRGEIAMKGGKPVLVFQGAPEAIEINGTRYEYSDGRVFLVSRSEGKLKVKQLDLPIKNGDRKDEITRLSEQKEVQDFLKK